MQVRQDIQFHTYAILCGDGWLVPENIRSHSRIAVRSARFNRCLGKVSKRLHLGLCCYITL